MRIEQRRWTPDSGWTVTRPAGSRIEPQLVLLFGGTGLIDDASACRQLRDTYPGAQAVGCSTAGEIRGVDVTLEEGVATAIQFESPGIRLQVATETIENGQDSESAGRRLAGELPSVGLVYVLVLSPGLDVNGSALVRGLQSGLPDSVIVTGGLAGDGDRFDRTLVWSEAGAAERTVAVVGFSAPLVRAGYRVISAMNGREALDVIEKHRREISLVATDVVMPVMTGSELATQLAIVAPEIPMLFISGYADETIVRQGGIKPGSPFLQKPFTVDGLTAKVREVLDAPRSSVGAP